MLGDALEAVVPEAGWRPVFALPDGIPQPPPRLSPPDTRRDTLPDLAGLDPQKGTDR